MGRRLIERWQDPALGLGALPYEAPYSLQTRHKHMPEMTAYSGLRHEPLFVPAVGPSVRPLLEGRATDEHSLDRRACNDSNRLELQVIDHESGHVNRCLLNRVKSTYGPTPPAAGSSSPSRGRPEGRRPPT